MQNCCSWRGYSIRERGARYLNRLALTIRGRVGPNRQHSALQSNWNDGTFGIEKVRHGVRDRVCDSQMIKGAKNRAPGCFSYCPDSPRFSDKICKINRMTHSRFLAPPHERHSLDAHRYASSQQRGATSELGLLAVPRDRVRL